MSEASVGVYVHVPFCDRVCPYCDFAVVAGGVDAGMEARYVRALTRELAARRARFAGRRLASVYLGGGTPSLLTPDAVARLVGAVRDAFSEPASPCEPAPAVEVTLEVNPSTLERDRLPGFREAGVNRLSVGIQSFDDRVLKRLGRAHLAAEGRTTLEAARAAGFGNLSLDLLFAAPGQTLAQLESDLRETVAFGPEHVSTYELVVEAGTPFALADARGQLERADADAAADMVEAIDAALGSIGLAPYELTNYARAGRESVHNQRYWRREPVLGLGVGAWSSDPAGEGAPHGARRANTRSLPDYLARIERGDPAWVSEEVLTGSNARAETVFLSLRTRAGLDASRFVRWFGAPPRAWYDDEISELVGRGLLVESESGDLRVSPRGRLLTDLVCERFVEAAPEPPSD